MLQNYVHNKAKIYISNISSYKKGRIMVILLQRYYYRHHGRGLYIEGH